MSKNKLQKLGDLQLKIMKVLWQRSEASVADVYEILGRELGLAYTTIATMLRKMEVRGLVKHRQEERKFIYLPKVKEEEVTRKMSAHFLSGLFDGSLADMFSHLIHHQDISHDELDRLEKLIAERKQKK